MGWWSSGYFEGKRPAVRTHWGPRPSSAPNNHCGKPGYWPMSQMRRRRHGVVNCHTQGHSPQRVAEPGPKSRPLPSCHPTLRSQEPSPVSVLEGELASSAQTERQAETKGRGQPHYLSRHGTHPHPPCKNDWLVPILQTRTLMVAGEPAVCLCLSGTRPGVLLTTARGSHPHPYLRAPHQTRGR